MSDYKRRPILTGDTANPVLSQPELRGPFQKGSDGGFSALPLPSELVIETEDAATSGGVSVTFTDARTMVYVLSRINTLLAGYATAEEYEGCLVIRSDGVGDGSYVRILPPISGFDDASYIFGFEAHPHPLATVRAGDQQNAPVRPGQEGNPIGTTFLATGEDRVASAYNRALHSLGKNADTLYTWLLKPLPRMAVLEIDETTHASYLDFNADGTLDQIDISDLTVFDATLSGARLYVGGLSRTSTLDELLELYAIQDRDDNELMSADRVVRVGAVTRGQRGLSRPSWADEFTAPSSPVADTAGVAADGGNALGVDRIKQSSVQITGVRERTTLVCPDAGFETNGVAAGDVAVVSGATVDTPFNHNGTYLVETVVSETVVILRPHHDTGSVQELNPDEGGDFGSVVISSGGEWAAGLWLTLEPALPRMPASGKIRLLVPVESTLGDMPLRALLGQGARTSDEVDGWVIDNLWRRQSLDGVYQGQGQGNGGGFRAEVTHRPLTLAMHRTHAPSSGSVLRASTSVGTLALDTFRLTAAAEDRFEPEDVGRAIRLSLPGDLTEEPWTVVQWLDPATVVLAPPVRLTGYRGTVASTASTDWSILTGESLEIPGMLRLISPETFGDEALTASDVAGIVYMREQKDTVSDGQRVPGALSFAHLEKVKLRNDGGTPVNAVIVVATQLQGSGDIRLPFDPEGTSQIVPTAEADHRSVSMMGGISFVRVLHGTNAGIYVVRATRSATGTSGYNGLDVRNLDGSAVTFASESNVSICFYTLRVGVGTTVRGGSGDPEEINITAALSLFEDAHEQEEIGMCLRMGWRGAGYGIYSQVGDPEFWAYDAGDGASGTLIMGLLYNVDGIALTVSGADSGVTARRRASGIGIQAHTNAFDMDLESVPAAGFDFSSGGYGGWISQSGEDPALIVTKHVDAAPNFPSMQYSGISGSAALSVARAGSAVAAGEAFTDGIVGRGSALEIRGSSWVYRNPPGGHTEGQVGWAGSGVFVEDAVGAGRWLYPSMGAYEPDGAPYYGVASPTSGWDAPVHLGYPGQLIPEKDTGSPLRGDIAVEDFGTFGIPHEAVLTFYDLSQFSKPWSRYVGLRVRVLESGHEAEDEEFVIVAARQTATATLKFALHHETAGTITGPVAAISVVFRGQRWWAGYIDIAAYAHVGTAFEVSDFHKLPVIDVGSEMEAEDLEPALTSSLRVGVGGLISPPPVDASAAGAGIGHVQDIADMTDYASRTWSGLYVNGFTENSGTGSLWIESDWGNDAEEPNTPFPNIFTIVTDNEELGLPTLSDGIPGNLVSQEIALEHVTKNSTHGAIVQWNETMGGCLLIRSHPDNVGTTTDTVRLWKRGFKRLNLRSYSLRARIKYSMTSLTTPATVTVALRDSTGDIIESDSFVPTNDYMVHEQVYTWTNHSLTTDTYDAIESGDDETNANQGYHLTLDVPVDEVLSGLYVMELRIDEIARPMRVHHGLDVAGVMRARNYRFGQLVPGGQAVGPAEVDFLEDDAYGRGPGSYDNGALASSTEYNYGDAESHGVGFLRDSSGTWWRPVFPRGDVFKKGRFHAAMRLSTPYFDPHWYFEAALDEHSAGDLATNGLLAYTVLPGRTGFIVPFTNVPHGAWLTSLNWALSFSPGVDWEYPTDKSFWGIYRGLPSAWGTNLIPNDAASWRDSDDWEAEAGVLIKLWRYNAVSKRLGRDLTLTTYQGSASIEEATGPECIYTYEVDLSGVTPTHTGNFAGSGAGAGSGHFLLEEHEDLGGVDLMSNLKSAGVDRQVLRADRRQYAYYATIEFFGGPRQLAAGGGDFEALSSAGGYRPATQVFGAQEFEGVKVDFPYANLEPAQAVGAAPSVKFRGMQLRWVTDRVGDDWG